MDIVPPDASKRTLTPDSNGGAQVGVEYKWTDSESGNVVRMRVHGPDGKAPAGSHASEGDIYRISIGGKYQDAEGNLYHRQVHNPNSPHHDPDGANRTHIPWPSQHQLPY
ncbi:MAG TPA: polymorphic toxin type 30 domain-containing protein [Streptomyces sp.]|nr:polymorphic toxin type 30 domain-containing protein [Streptomyces sp.]